MHALDLWGLPHILSFTDVCYICSRLIMHCNNDIKQWCIIAIISIWYILYTLSICYAFDKCYNQYLYWTVSTYIILSTLCDSPSALRNRFKNHHVFLLKDVVYEMHVLSCIRLDIIYACFHVVGHVLYTWYQCTWYTYLLLIYDAWHSCCAHLHDINNYCMLTCYQSMIYAIAY